MDITIHLDNFPTCPSCAKGIMLPLTDTTKEGVPFTKMWACTKCFHNIGLKSGSLVKQEINTNA